MSSWLYWNRWEDMYRQWEQWAKANNKTITLTYPSLKGLFDWFARELQLHPEVDVQLLDIEHTLSYDLTVQDAKEALKALMITKPSEQDYERAAQEGEAEIEREIREKYPEFLDEFQARVESEVRKGIRRGEAHWRSVAEQLRTELTQTRKRAEQEKKARAENVKPVKLKVLRDFTEGILTYRAETQIEPADTEWVLARIAEGKLARVEAPPLPAPPAAAAPTPVVTVVRPEEVLPIQPRFLTTDQVKNLWVEVIAYAHFNYPNTAIGTDPKIYEMRFLQRVRDARTFSEGQERARRLVDEIVKESQPRAVPAPAPRAPAEAERIPYELGTNHWWVERMETERSREVPSFVQWMAFRGRTTLENAQSTFMHLSEAEQKRLLDEYQEFVIRETRGR